MGGSSAIRNGVSNMWRDYSADFIRKNRASSISIIVAALISSLFLSLLCSLFFNFWMYEIEQIILEEGDWQGRITGELDDTDLAIIQNFANVKRAVINAKLSEGQETVIDVYFQNAGMIFRDMPLITEKLGLEEGAADYHVLLLSRYMIHDPQDTEPPLLMAFYLMILLMVSVSLILIIHNSFAVSMNARIRQFGIFAGIGAAPELSAIPVKQPIKTGTAQSTAASCSKQVKICPGAAPIPAKMPNCRIRAFMDTAKEV